MKSPGLSERPWFVYPILCDDQSLYVGVSQNVEQRFTDHLAGRGATWTARHKPAQLVHQEEYATSEEAFSREKELKTGFGRKWLKREYRAGRLRGPQ